MKKIFTSLPFILLILFGYVAGIISKMLTLAAGKATFGYVHVMYFINLITVSSNLVIYFLNCRKDKLAAAKK